MTWNLLGYICALAAAGLLLVSMANDLWLDLRAGWVDVLLPVRLLTALACVAALAYLCSAGPQP